MSALEKTIELALEKARENKVSEATFDTIKALIKGAFRSYADAWEGVHSFKETAEDWEWFYNCLKEKSLTDVLRDLNYEKAKRSDPWTFSFISVVQILQGKKLMGEMKIVTMHIEDGVCILRPIPPQTTALDINEVLEKCIEIRLETADGRVWGSYWKGEKHE